MKRYVKLLSVIAALLTVTLAVKPALAYFTTYTEVGGTMKVTLTEETKIEEPNVLNWKKDIVISNADNANVEVYVRAIAYQPANMPALQYSGTGWTFRDGYYYYSKALGKGEEAEHLFVQISGVPEDTVAELGDTFNVVVVYECVPVQYDANGNALPPEQCDWSMAAKDGGWEE